MMPELRGLSKAFVEAHPADAARVLEALPAAETAGFVAQLDARLGAPVVRQMGPAYAARVVALLEEGCAGSLIQIMGPQPAAQIVQNLTNDRQMKLLARLPVGTSIAIRLLVGYPRGTCGAYMDPAVATLAPDMNAGDALQQIRTQDGDVHDCAFVRNGQRRLCGVLRLAALVRAPSRELVSVLMEPPVHTLAALASVNVAASHPGWDQFLVMPVVERENRLVGALHRRVLAAALALPGARREPSAASGVFAAYWHTVSALTELAVGALPPVPPILEKEKGDER
jgi:magnesium transporter